MANPQAENGHTQINHETMMALLSYNFGSEFPLKICLFVIRKTWGFKKKVDLISITQFQKAIGCSRPTIVFWLNYLVKHLLLVKEVLPVGCKYGLNKDYSRWLVKDPLLVKGRAFKLVKGVEHTKERQKKAATSVINFYENNLSTTLNRTILEELESLEKTYGDKNLIEAMKISVLKGVKTLAFVKGVLKREEASGFRWDKDSAKISGFVDSTELPTVI
ncbi:MAG: replication protein [Candidatus Bathyarchaeota archaeon]